MTNCLLCERLAPLKNIPEGHPSETELSQQGMLARGLAYCGLKSKFGDYKKIVAINARFDCGDFVPVKDQSRIAARVAIAQRLQKKFADKMAALRESRKGKKS